VYVKIAHVRANVTWNLYHYLDPLVQGVGGEVVFGSAHGVVAANVFIHQAFPMLKRLDPLGEP
jgi:hypothetical protein